MTGNAAAGDDDGGQGEKQVTHSGNPSGAAAAAAEGAEGAESAEGAGAPAKSSDVTANPKKGLLSSGAAATRTGEAVPGRELVFQFMEQSSPYSRAPLSDILASLAETEPALMTLTSDELHPASWLSIAWYPIYRIPVGRSLRDLSACFLTYHALSTAAAAERKSEREGGDDEKNAATAGTGGGGDGDASDAATASGVGASAVSAAAAPAAAEVGSSGAGAGRGVAAVMSAEARSREWVAAGGCPAPPPVSAHGEAAMSTRISRLRGADPASRPRMGLR